nr:hypothetical protein [Kibdelosporangium sp. MJ126-NF4]CEL19183.1 hypothetical protein [Kibdelosporangium sp. MJ126-NF4]CTQ95016.1 hypothetical protein [Kibdelosporangium sp. MJ126-NF4]
MKTRIVTGLVGGLLVLGVGASPALAETGTTATQQAAFHNQQTVVTVDSGAATALEFFNIKLDALRPAFGTATTNYTFPACTRNGVTELSGGLKFAANDKTVKVTSIVINTNTKAVKASLNGRRTDVFSLDGQNLVLTAAGATALNTGLGFDGLFAEGFLFGGFTTNK